MTETCRVQVWRRFSSQRNPKKHRPTAPLVGVSLALMLFLASCGSDTTTAETTAAETTQAPETTAAPETTETTETTEATETTATPETTEAVTQVHVDFSAAAFDNPTVIDNEWFTLTPGNRLVLDGLTVEDGESFDHRIEFIVTDLTKEIAGVVTVVAWIEDYSDDELVEAELAFYAQDNDGNVWFMGEYPEEYEDGEFIAAPAWIPFVKDALPGIKMFAEPHPDLSPYYQGWGPEVEWSDFGRIESIGEERCVELDCYEVLLVAESSLGEEGIFQLKSYAKGVGNVHVDFRGDDATQEQLEAVEFGPISADELARYRDLALAMEAHAYEISPDVYGTTPPLK